ncbi:hypothetical protein GCM10022206_82330 [Streptomyces chiangmaiensis]
MLAPVCATNPVTIAVKVSKLGAVNTCSVSNTASKDRRYGGLGSIGGSPPRHGRHTADAAAVRPADSPNQPARHPPG